MLHGVPVLLYHGLLAATSRRSDPLSPWTAWRESRYWLPAESLRAQLGEIRRLRLRQVLLRELLDQQHPSACAAISFDDGRDSDYTLAFPLLTEFGSRATFFVNTATVGAKGYLTWQEIADMHRSGMSVESHGDQHCYLTRLSKDELLRQISRSRQVLEDRLGCRIRLLALPYGDSNAVVCRIALEEGYEGICTSRSWPATPGRRLIPRICVYAGTSKAQFLRLITLNPLGFLPRAIREGALFIPKRLTARLRAARRQTDPAECLTNG